MLLKYLLGGGLGVQGVGSIGGGLDVMGDGSKGVVERRVTSLEIEDNH